MRGRNGCTKRYNIQGICFASCTLRSPVARAAPGVRRSQSNYREIYAGSLFRLSVTNNPKCTADERVCYQNVDVTAAHEHTQPQAVAEGALGQEMRWQSRVTHRAPPRGGVPRTASDATYRSLAPTLGARDALEPRTRR
ncbi:hypothetical protein EVAR_26943_1 [Eumeta japonica]|uniref:Uncharacterized protein n=1 Tax=Eumeta variegata TaxID=151549 RepID=A0A4C1VLH7_EUMVA|nr:hypothetical protein EVAR_26943_1 [Eumeta japonica]